MTRFIAAGVLIASLMAGSALHAEPINTNYVISNRDAVGVIRAFDDGSNTIVQFVDLDQARPTFADRYGKHVSYRRVGDYAVLPGVIDDVRISTDGRTAEVRSGGSVATGPAAMWPAPAPALAAAPLPVSPKSAPVAHVAPSAATLKPAAAAVQVPSQTPPSHWPTALHPMPPTPATLAAVRMVSPGRKAALPKVVHAAPIPVAPTTIEPRWQAAAGTDAKTMLIGWARTAHWTVHWDAPFTFPIDAPLSYGGDFVAAVSQHFKHYMNKQKTDHPICVDMHRGNDTIHVYLPDESNHCGDDAPKAIQ